MNVLDPILIVIFVVATGLGFYWGIIKSLGYGIAVILAFFLARLASPFLYTLLSSFFTANPDLGKTISFVIIFTICALLLQVGVALLDRRSNEDKTNIEKVGAACAVLFLTVFLTGMLLVLNDAYIELCTQNPPCNSTFVWVQTNDKSALLAPFIKNLGSTLFKLFLK